MDRLNSRPRNDRLVHTERTWGLVLSLVIVAALLPSCCPSTCSDTLTVTVPEGTDEFVLRVTTATDRFAVACPEPSEQDFDEDVLVGSCVGNLASFESWGRGWTPPVVYELNGLVAEPLSEEGSTRHVCGVLCAVLDVRL